MSGLLSTLVFAPPVKNNQIFSHDCEKQSLIWSNMHKDIPMMFKQRKEICMKMTFILDIPLCFSNVHHI